MSASLAVIDPATGASLRELRCDDAAGVERIADAARAAQPGWAALTLSERGAPIARFAALLTERREALARLLITDMGKPIAQARRELEATVARVGFFCEHVGAALAERVVHRESGLREVVVPEALGTVLHLSAWNYPWFVAVNTLVPALLTGNAVLYKPSEHATQSGLALVALLHEAGVPRAVVAAVIGAGATGQALLDQPVQGVFFTGSHATGLKVAAAAARRLARVQLELGGKDPVYVCDDADPAAAAAAVADGAFYNNGQSCCAVERVYVHRRIAPAFIDAFVATVDGFRLGDPLDEGTYLGPLARAAQLDVLTAQIADARAKGGRVLRGGARLDRPGNWFAPTVVVDVDHGMELMREETFGPAIGIMVIDDDAQATALMDDTRYGLTAGVYSRDEARARRVLGALRTGSAYWNCCDRVSPRLPWSGRRDSGFGCTLGDEGIAAFTQPRAWHLRSS